MLLLGKLQWGGRMGWVGGFCSAAQLCRGVAYLMGACEHVCMWACVHVGMCACGVGFAWQCRWLAWYPYTSYCLTWQVSNH